MTNRKGIILAGGLGSRLSPITTSISKQLLPIYNKPMIYYSLSVLMLAGIREILLISQSNFIPLYKNLLNDGNHLGLKISYLPQDIPKGIAEAFRIGETFINKSKIALVLGDNIFYGSTFSKSLMQASKSTKITLFSSVVKNPSQFGVVSYRGNKPIKIIEKPKIPPSNEAITGLYFYNNDVVELSKKLKPSSRGELEITDINDFYLKKNQVNITRLPRATLWLDTGTFENIHQCSQIIYSIEKNTNIKVGCIEEIAFHKKWISVKDLKSIIKKYPNNEYSEYLRGLI